MPFKLLKLVWIVSGFSFALLGLRLEPCLAQATSSTRNFQYLNKIPVLEGISVRVMAIRPDGRYLFFSSGDTSFNVLDLLDLSHLGTAVTVSGNIKAMKFNQNQLIVATTAGVQYFNVSEVFDLADKEEGNKFTKPTEETTTVMDACIGSDNVAYLLETGTGFTNKRIRSVRDKVEVTRLAWENLYGQSDLISPVGILCGKETAFVFASETSGGKENHFYAREVNASAIVGATTDLRDPSISDVTSTEYYQRVDFLLNSKNNQILSLYNRETPFTNAADKKNDSKVVFKPGIGSTSVYSVGSEAKALLRLSEAGADFYSVFVGKDYWQDEVSVPTDQLIIVPAGDGFTNLGGNVTHPRGQGSSEVGVVVPTLSVSTDKDHYQFVAQSSGVALVSKAPRLRLDSSASAVASPGVYVMSAAAPLSLTLSSDLEVRYEVRFDETAFDSKGLPLGSDVLDPLKYGSVKKEGALPANSPQTIEIKPSDIGVVKQGTHPLLITAYDASQTNAVRARLGVQFSYDPPPDPVRNLSLRIGDQSVHVVFDPPSGEDLQYYYIYSGYDRAALDALDLTTSVPDKTTYAGVSGYTLESPAVISAADFNGRYVIFPVENERELYVRVQSMDKSGQLGLNPAPAMAATPYRTLTVTRAVGSPLSCQLRPDAGFSIKELKAHLLSTLIFFGLGLMGLMFLRRFQASKKIGPSSSRNRRGGD